MTIRLRLPQNGSAWLRPALGIGKAAASALPLKERSDGGAASRVSRRRSGNDAMPIERMISGLARRRRLRLIPAENSCDDARCVRFATGKRHGHASEKFRPARAESPYFALLKEFIRKIGKNRELHLRFREKFFTKSARKFSTFSIIKPGFSS